MRPFISDDNAVNVEIGYIMSLVVLIIITGSITGMFYVYTDHSSEQAMRASFTDLGSQIARDITNMYLISADSPDDVNLSIKRKIPLTLGGKGYRIELKNATSEKMASVDISEGAFGGYTISTTLNSINNPVGINDTASPVLSGSGELNIRLIKNNGDLTLWIK